MTKTRHIKVHVRPITVNITENTKTPMWTVNIPFVGIPSDGIPTTY